MLDRMYCQTTENKKSDYFILDAFSPNNELLDSAIIKKYHNNHTEVNETFAKILDDNGFKYKHGGCYFHTSDLLKDEGGLHYFPWVEVEGVGKHRKTYVTMGIVGNKKLKITKLLDFFLK